VLPTDISTGGALAHLSQPDRDAHALDRRRFLQLIGMGAGAGLVAGGTGSLLDLFVPGLDPAAWALGPVGPNDGILVVLGMYGGNDGLNTIIPTGGPDHGRYIDQHGVLAIAPEDALPLDVNPQVVDHSGLAGISGLNPRLGALHELWQDGQLAIVEGVGYPGLEPDLSHFSSMAKYMAARPQGVTDSGWVGRWLDGYTGGRADLFAGAAVGSSVPLHMIGKAARATGVSDSIAAWGAATDTRSERGYQAVRRMLTTVNGPWHEAATRAYLDGFDVVAATAPFYPPAPQPGDPLVPEIITRMDVIARLINANLGFRVLTAGWGDFDSHAGQPDMHDARMSELNAAIERFYAVLHPGWASRVAVMTFSEFGRTANANAGQGTDHGSAAPQLVFGANVRGGFYGARPSLASSDGNPWVRMESHVDLRTYYGSVVDGWLGGPPADELFGGAEFGNLGLFRRAPGVIDDAGTTAPMPTVIGGLSAFVPVVPRRVVDTRVGTGVAAGPLGPRAVLRVPIAGVGDVPADGVTAVVANITAVDATELHYFTAYPGGTTKPATSNVNGGPGRAVPNLVTVGVGLDGHIEVFNSHGQVHCLVDVFGYYTSQFIGGLAGGDRFVPLSPQRLFDTRSGHGVAPGKLGHLAPIDVQVAGLVGVPADATAVVLNLTVTEPDAPGYLRLTPSGEPIAATSNVNFFAGDTVPNLAIVRLGAGGRVQLDGAGAGKHAVGDVFGFFGGAAAAAGSRLRAAAPRRLLDTREGLGAAKAPVGPGRTIDVTVAGRAGVPAHATAVVLNVTATNVVAASYVTVWPGGESMPGTSNLNVVAGQTLANLVVCRLGAGGVLTFANKLADCDVIADVMAYFVP
jgi:uncharacterized protein (DUF1501 family)